MNDCPEAIPEDCLAQKPPVSDTEILLRVRYNPSMTINTDLFQNWSWQLLLEVLSGVDNGNPLREATLLLRRLQKMAFSELRAAIENAENPATSWDDPFLLIRFDLPGRISRTKSADQERIEFEQSDPAVGALLEVLTPGASAVSQGDRLYPSAPAPVADALAIMDDVSKKTFFDQWMQPVLG